MSESTAAASFSQNWETLAVHDWDGDTELIVELAEVLDELSTDDAPVLDEYVDAESLCNGLQAVAGRQFTEVRFSVDTYEVRIRQNGAIEARRQLHSE
ncbi:HalOD1 output domain-containing protein [Haloarcula sebkhae]|nr:HalOD1 output domain-containing protein [Haloarcula sebkhae]